MSREGLSKIALIGNYLPRKCGIATFTYDLSRALTHEGSGPECFVVAVNDRPEGYAYSPDVRFEIAEQDLPSYRLAADFLQSANVDVLCVQHEFGIYGGTAGSHLLALLRRLDLPIVTHLHTILEEPSLEQMDVMQELICLSTRLIVMNKRGRRILKETYNTPSERIDLIPHGIPDMPFVDPDLHKTRFGLEGKRVLFTFGLISPGKGLEYVIRALPEVLEVFPDLIYIVLGATHPTLLREQGETYRMNLERLAAELGVAKNVIFLNRFVQSKELMEYFNATDIYITPYLNASQITSGTLAYSFGCGKAVIATPYWHAEELLSNGRGILVPFRDSQAIARELIALFKDDKRRDAMRQRAYLLGRTMVWNKVVQRFLTSRRQAWHSRQADFASWQEVLREEPKLGVAGRIGLSSLRHPGLRSALVVLVVAAPADAARLPLRRKMGLYQ
jgi:glycosyltransferase involved in cell wall biosynthesis